MPVPGGRLEPETVIRLEITLEGAQQLNEQNESPERDVEAVKAGQQENVEP